MPLPNEQMGMKLLYYKKLIMFVFEYLSLKMKNLGENFSFLLGSDFFRISGKKI